MGRCRPHATPPPHPDRPRAPLPAPPLTPPPAKTPELPKYVLRILGPVWSDLATHLSANAPAVRTELARIVREAAEVESAPKRAERELAVALVRAIVSTAPDRVRDDPALLGPTGATAWEEVLAGVVWDALGATTEAAVLLERGVNHLAAEPDPSLDLPARSALAVAYTHLGDVARAARAWHDAADLAHHLGELRQEATFTANLGFLYGEHDEPGPYERYTRRALELLREVGEPRLIAHALCNLGGALQRAGRTAEARSCYEEGLPLALALDWPNGHALYHAGFGGVLIQEGRVDDGLASYEESLRILTRLGDVWQHTRHQFIIGRHLVEIGRFDAAADRLEACLAAARARAFGSIEANCLQYLAQAREGMGDAAGALQALWAHLGTRGTEAAAHVADRVRVAEVRLEAETMRREAARERVRSTELQRLNEELAAALAQRELLQGQLEALARTDVLTGLPNRRHQQAVLDGLDRAPALALALVDVDHFKTVNDRFGHAVGDAVLVELASRLQRCLRGSDSVARWGGEEFCVTMPNTPAMHAQSLGERLARVVAEAPFAAGGVSVNLTISVGIAADPTGELQVASLLQLADQALYSAKHAGRARVVVAPMDGAPTAAD